MATKTKPPKANGGKVKTGEVLPAVDQDQSALMADGSAIATFIANAGAFFSKARDLEEQSKSTLVIARTLIEPTTQEQDEEMQAFIRKANAGTKAIEAHWDICGVFHKMHRMLTARRGIGVAAYTDAAQIAQRHHNNYAEKERRRAAEEQERLRIKAENEAREARERELAEAEKRALDLEAASEDLSEREKQFVKLIVAGMLPTHAARQVGYKNPDQQGASLMERPKIQSAIAAKREADAILAQTAAKRDAPLSVEVPIVKPAISRGPGGGHDRTSHTGEVLDEQAFIAAVIAGKHGIPWDVLTVNQTKLNDYARSLQERLNTWPGVRHVKKTTTV